MERCVATALLGIQIGVDSYHEPNQLFVAACERVVQCAAMIGVFQTYVRALDDKRLRYGRVAALVGPMERRDSLSSRLRRPNRPELPYRAMPTQHPRLPLSRPRPAGHGRCTPSNPSPCSPRLSVGSRPGPPPPPRARATAGLGAIPPLRCCLLREERSSLSSVVHCSHLSFSFISSRNSNLRIHRSCTDTLCSSFGCEGLSERDAKGRAEKLARKKKIWRVRPAAKTNKSSSDDSSLFLT